MRTRPAKGQGAQFLLSLIRTYRDHRTPWYGKRLYRFYRLIISFTRNEPLDRGREHGRTLPGLVAFHPSIARLFTALKVHKKFTLWLQPSRFPLMARGNGISTYRYTINREANTMKNKAKPACKIRRFLVHFGPLGVLFLALSGCPLVWG